MGTKKKDQSEIEEIEVNEPQVVEVPKVEAKHVFIKPLVTATKTYQIGDDCLETNDVVIQYLTKERFIKPKK